MGFCCLNFSIKFPSWKRGEGSCGVGSAELRAIGQLNGVDQLLVLERWIRPTELE
jgi:hypothetical protein